MAALWLLAAPVALYVLARLVGLGTCLDCGRSCQPWNAFCWRHQPGSGGR